MEEVSSVKRELAAIKFDGLTIAVPLSEVQSLDPVLDVRFESARRPSIGYVEYDDARLPVFSLDGNLKPLADVPEGQRICAMLGKELPWFGVICESITSLGDSVLQNLPVPECMTSGSSPIKSLVLDDETVLCATDVDELVRYLERPEFSDSSGAKPAERQLQ